MTRPRHRVGGASGRIIDVSCYVIVDLADAAARLRDPLDLVRAALSGGATVVQVRAKEMGARAIATLVRQALPLARAVGVPLIVNDPDWLPAAMATSAGATVPNDVLLLAR